jgi:hypothetical protein
MVRVKKKTLECEFVLGSVKGPKHWGGGEMKKKRKKCFGMRVLVLGVVKGPKHAIEKNVCEK